MKTTSSPGLNPCVVTAIALSSPGNSPFTAGPTHHILDIVRRLFDPEVAKLHGSHLTVTGRWVLHVAPIKPGGQLLFHAVLRLVHLQPELMRHGVLARGAMALGEVAFRGELLFGPGILEAERLRDEVALAPRIVVDPRLLREVEENSDLRASHHTVLDELDYIRGLLARDADAIWFVDYLRAIRGEVDEREAYLDLLKDHRRAVSRGLDEAVSLDGGSRAYTWLWSYHNQVVKEVQADWRLSPEEREALGVPLKSALVFDFPRSGELPQELSAADIPQADDLVKLLEMVARMPVEARGEAEPLQMTPRVAAYYHRAAQILGFLSKTNELTAGGRQISRLGAAERLRVTAVRFEATRCGEAWLHWAKGKTLLDLDASSAFAFLRERAPGLSYATARRRAHALESWCRALVAYHYARP